MRLFTGCLVLGLLAAGCSGDGSDGTAGDDPSSGTDRRYGASTTVLESPEHGPQLCLGAVNDSFPPQCGGPDVVGWDWDAVDGEESAGGTTWGEYSVVGTWDGERLTLTEPPGPPKEREGERVDFSTPCDAPPGGWAVVDPATTTQEALDAAMQHAREQPDFGGAWVDQSINPAHGSEDADTLESRMNDPALLVLNLRFTGDLERHEREARQIWGGSLCVTEARHTEANLRAIQDELSEVEGFLSSGVDVTRGVVELGVVFDDGELQRELDERHGAGVVEVRSGLQPVA